MRRGSCWASAHISRSSRALRRATRQAANMALNPEARLTAAAEKEGVRKKGEWASVDMVKLLANNGTNWCDG